MKKILRLGFIVTLLVSTFFTGVLAIDFDNTVIFYSETGGGEITFSYDIDADSLTWVNDQIRFTNLTFAGSYWGDIGFSAPNTSVTMNVDLINASHILISTTQTENTTYKVWLPDEYEPNFSGGDSYWVSEVLTYSMVANGTVTIDWLATPPNPPIPEPTSFSLIDSYPESNYDSSAGFKTVHPSAIAQQSAWGQTFNATGDVNLTSVKFYLRKIGAPTGELVAYLYATVAGKPAGAALATGSMMPSSVLTGDFALYSFNFTGDERYQLVTGTTYGIGLEANTSFVSTVSYPAIGFDSSAPSHAGNSFFYQNGVWSTYASDLVFYVYGDGYAPEILDITDEAFTRNVPNWINVTLRDTNGASNLKNVTIQVNTTGDTNTFQLNWVQTTDVFTESLDPDNICILNTTYSTATLINATSYRVSFYVNITAGQSGTTTIYATVTDDDNLQDTDSQTFTFTYFDWDTAVYDLINSLFENFGIVGWVQQTIAAVTSVATHFTDSLAGLILLINLQFQIVWATFGWFTTWATRMITGVINFGTAMKNIMNGISTGTSNLWSDFNFAAWGPDLMPVFLIVYWINSVSKRGKTQGLFTVLNGDLNAFANIFAYFMGVFNGLIGFIEGRLSWFSNFLQI